MDTWLSEADRLTFEANCKRQAEQMRLRNSAILKSQEEIEPKTHYGENDQTIEIDWQTGKIIN
jgi:hypothetical protein